MRGIKYLIYVLLAIGLASSLYLININMNQTICLPDETCVHENGLLFASLGAIWFVAGFAINTFARQKPIVMAWAITGFLGIAFFWSLMISEDYFCRYCIIAHISGGSAGILSIWSLRFHD